MLRFDQVSLSYGSQKVIDNISFEIQAGQMAVLIGPSGCGKTTTLKMINRLIEPVNDRQIWNLSPRLSRCFRPCLLRQIIQQRMLQIHLSHPRILHCHARVLVNNKNIVIFH